MPSGDYLTAAACCLKRNWHLRPLSRYPPGIVPYCYWLLLMAGDVEPNPGPAKHPLWCLLYTARSSPTNSVSIVTAVISGNIVSIEYLSLVQSDEPWCCPTCLKEAFPFHNCSDISFDLPHPNPLSPPDPQSPPAPPPAPPATPHPNQLCSIFYLNCRSLLPKLDALRVQAMSSNPSIIALVETWLDTSISSQEFSIPGYSCIRRDRHRHGGGILL